MWITWFPELAIVVYVTRFFEMKSSPCMRRDICYLCDDGLQSHIQLFAMALTEGKQGNKSNASGRGSGSANEPTATLTEEKSIPANSASVMGSEVSSVTPVPAAKTSPRKVAAPIIQRRRLSGSEQPASSTSGITDRSQVGAPVQTPGHYIFIKIPYNHIHDFFLSLQPLLDTLRVLVEGYSYSKSFFSNFIDRLSLFETNVP